MLVSKIIEELWRFVKLSVELLDLDIPMKFQQINCFHDISVPRNEKSPDQLESKLSKVTFSSSDSIIYHVDRVHVSCKHFQKQFEMPKNIKFILVATQYEV